MDETLARDDENVVTAASATESGMTETAVTIPDGKRTCWAPLFAVVAWVLPGLGHALLGRWGRALAFFVAVGGLAITGYLMRGEVFTPHSEDPFGTVGFLADAGSGIFYLLAHFFEPIGPEIGRAAGDYGTRFIASAGIVNVLGAFDAYEIARGRRS